MLHFNRMVNILKNSLLRVTESRNDFDELENIIMTWEQMMFNVGYHWDEILDGLNLILNSVTDNSIHTVIKAYINEDRELLIQNKK